MLCDYRDLKLSTSRSRFWQNEKVSDSKQQVITQWAIGAHQDDVEIMAAKAIVSGLKGEANFGAIVASDGRGSARLGKYKDYSDEKMAETRLTEQEVAAKLGKYTCLFQLGYPSSEIKDPNSNSLESDLLQIFNCAKSAPDVLYTHNLADKHETHVALSLKVIKALRDLPKSLRPKQVLGSEVWRGLDWLNDNDKVVLDLSENAKTVEELINCHDSQTQGGKRYDLAVTGRMRSNATFFQAHQTDKMSHIWYAMDLTLLVNDRQLDIEDFVLGHIEAFKTDVANKLKKFNVS